MMEGDANPNRGFMGVFWSCDAGHVVTENPNLAYHIPREGGNIYVDAMVIPSTSRNPAAANRFLYYINSFNAENPAASAAFRNMSAVGAPSAVEAAMVAFRSSLLANDEVANIYGYTMEDLFGDQKVGDRDTDMYVWEMYVNIIMFPHLYERYIDGEYVNQNILNRTQYMRDWGADVENELTLMWNRVQVAPGGCAAAGPEAVGAAFIFLGFGGGAAGTGKLIHKFKRHRNHR